VARASEELLNAGCIYEYARESYEFRCLRALDRRERGQFPGGILIKFERTHPGNTVLMDSGWETWLHVVADELVANKSFAELLRTNASRAKIENSLKQLRGYDLYPKALELPGRYINVPGMQEIKIQIDWRHYNNKEIAEEMKRFAEHNRPKSELEPNRRGKKRESKVRSDLKALLVMRIWKHEPDPWKRLKLVSSVCAYEAFENELKKYKKRCEDGQGDEPMGKSAQAEMTRARKRALGFFEYLFPWGKPSNY
jgi:hypothetical protein